MCHSRPECLARAMQPNDSTSDQQFRPSTPVHSQRLQCPDNSGATHMSVLQEQMLPSVFNCVPGAVQALHCQQRPRPQIRYCTPAMLSTARWRGWLRSIVVLHVCPVWSGSGHPTQTCAHGCAGCPENPSQTWALERLGPGQTTAVLHTCPPCMSGCGPPGPTACAGARCHPESASQQ